MNMLNSLRNNFNIDDYQRIVGKKTNIHKVSYFFKEDLKNLSNKRILFLDFEFSMNKIIIEVGGLVLENRKVVELIFDEYSLPPGEPYWDFDVDGFIDGRKLNKNKPLFSDKDQDKLFKLVQSVDYVVVHNYVAEAQCFLKLKTPYEKYNISNCDVFTQGKFICTSYSFKNKYFKSLGMTIFTNSGVSECFGWKIKDKESYLLVKNKSLNIAFKIDKPKGIKSSLHNSFYDSVVTLTNFMSFGKIIK